MTVNLWVNEEHALAYLRDRDTLPHRVDALEVVLELLPERVDRVLDLGTGDGVTLALVLAARAGARGVGVDFGVEMLRRARDRFAGDDRVEIVRHDLDEPLPGALAAAGTAPFDVVVSTFAIHHCAPARQRALYGEVFGLLRPGGLFVNADHVASPTPALHEEFLAELRISPDGRRSVEPAGPGRGSSRLAERLRLRALRLLLEVAGAGRGRGNTPRVGVNTLPGGNDPTGTNRLPLSLNRQRHWHAEGMR